MDVKSSITTNQQEIVEEFNDFFSKVGSKLAKNIDNSAHNFNEYLGSPQPQSILINKTSINEISDIINKLKNDKSPGYDSYNVRI